MTNSMIVANILHRPMRTAVSVIAVAIQVTLVLLVVGMTTWMRVDNAKRQEGIGADIMFCGSNFQVFFLSGAPMSMKFQQILEQVQGVKVVAPVLIQTTLAAGGVSNVYGIDLPSYAALSGGFNYRSGGPFRDPYDVLVDDLHAKNNKLKVGDTMQLLAHTFRVCGIVEHGKGARVFIRLDTLQNLMESPGKATLFYIKVNNPGQTQEVVDRIKNMGLQSYSVITIKDYLTQITTAAIPALDVFIDAMIFIACTIGFIVIYLSMYTTITERTREIGILKSLGASKLFIVNAILRESLLLCFLGILLGIGLSFLAKHFIPMMLPTLSVLITFPWVIKSALLALLAGLLGGFYPSLRAASQDPIAALSYE